MRAERDDSDHRLPTTSVVSGVAGARSRLGTYHVTDTDVTRIEARRADISI